MHQTNAMQQGPSWNANRNTVSTEISHTLWNPNVHYRFQKSPPPFPTLSHINPVHVSPSNFLQMHFNIILAFTSRSPKWYLTLSSSCRILGVLKTRIDFLAHVVVVIPEYGCCYSVIWNM
jgi:hypothetical protein